MVSPPPLLCSVYGGAFASVAALGIVLHVARLLLTKLLTKTPNGGDGSIPVLSFSLLFLAICG